MKTLIALTTATAVLAPLGAFAMPLVGAQTPASFEGAKVEQAAVIVRTGPRVVRPRVVVRRPVIRRPAARVIIR